MSDQTKTSINLDLPKALEIASNELASPHIRTIGALTAAALLIRDIDWTPMEETKRVNLGEIFIGLIEIIGNVLDGVE